MGVASVAITDTNSDPSLVDYPIPANDDAVGSLQLIIGYLMDAWIEGRNATQNEKLKIKSQKEVTKEIDKKAKESKTEDKPKAEKKVKATKE